MTTHVSIAGNIKTLYCNGAYIKKYVGPKFDIFGRVLKPAGTIHAIRLGRQPGPVGKLP